jgi:hypothetical protein
VSILHNCIIPDWPAPRNVRALQTTRLGGVSRTPYDSLNLGDHVGDEPLAVERNRILLNTLLPSEPVWLEQVHGTTVANAAMASSGCDTLLAKPADCGSSRKAAPLKPQDSTILLGGGCLPQADACIARHRAAVCVVMTADCLPILLCDTQGSVVGAVHAGWKGLAAGVVEAAVHAMETAPQSLMAWLGPAISQQAFEVGDEVRALFVDADQKAAVAFTPSLALAGTLSHEGRENKTPSSLRGEGVKWMADLYMLTRQRLNALGLTQIHGGGYCTYRDAERFFSYRRDGATGRMGTFIWLE